MQLMRNVTFIIWVVFVCFFNTQKVFAQDFSNKGKDFWITFPAHVDGTGAVMGIYITSDVAATGTVQVGNGGPALSFSIAANTVRRIFLGNTAANDAPNSAVYQDQLDGIKAGSAVRVVSDAPVVIYAHIIRSARSGSTLVLPTITWGRDYIVPSYGSQGASGNGSGRGGITVVAKETNTVVEIVPTASSFDGARPAGTAYTITLNNPGDVYQVQFQKDADISGTIVRSIATGATACKPIGVFSSTTWSAFSCAGSSGGDNLLTQLFPTRSYGRTYLTAPFANRETDIIRVFTIEPNTTITKRENNITTTLTVGPQGFAEYQTGNATLITSDKPVMVVQYITSQTCDSRNQGNCANNGTCPFPADPEMIVLSPIEQTLNNITVFSAHRNFVPPGQSNVDRCFLNIIIPTIATGSFRINGNSPTNNFVIIPGTSFSYLQENITNTAVSNPIQSLTADSNFSCIAYGFGNVESYGYNAGTNVRDLLQFITIRDVNRSVDAANVCAGTNFQWFITLPYPATKIEWRFNGAFPNLTINNPIPDSIYVKEGKTIYRFPVPGDYKYENVGLTRISVLATNPTSDGCTGEQQIDFDIQIFPKPANNFNLSHSGCLADSVTFTSAATIATPNTMVKWDWRFGDGISDTGRITRHKYAAGGTFNVSHFVTSNRGCVSDTVVKPVTINPNPVAAFNITGPFCQNQTLTITNLSTTQTGTITNWFWDMGNGIIFNRTNGAAFTYAYPAVGTYRVKLLVTNNAGCISDSVRQTIIVTHVPVSGFLLPEVCLNDAFAEFTNTSTIPDGTLAQTTWLWNFSDPNASPINPDTSILLNGRHRYTAAANYNVMLIATSGAGCKDSLTQTLTVNGDRPLANFNIFTPGNLCSNLPVQIQNKSTVNFGTVTRIIVSWDFLNNPLDTTIIETPAFDEIYIKNYLPFSSPATRQATIRLQAFSGTVCLNDSSKIITLQATPAVRFSVMPGICLDATPRAITQGFDAGGNTGSGIYSGSGINAAGLFTPTITGTGTFTLQYKYITSAGCTDSTTRAITVWPRPTADFTIGNLTCINTPVLLTNQSVANSNTITSWNWNYGDGNTETRNNGNPFSRNYANSQSYNISLSVTTDSGCVSTTVQKPISIYPKPVVDFDLPAVVCLPEGRANFVNRTIVGGTGGTPITYQWSFGPVGSSSTLVSPTYFYQAAGSFAVKQIATSSRGCLDSLSKTISNIVPQALANWAALPPEVCLGLPIIFEDRSNPLNNTITNWNWTLGDNSNSTQRNPTKTYTSAGTYTVSMFYTTNTGCNSDTLSKAVIVHPFPVVNAGPDQFVLQGGQVTLLATANGTTNLRYRWTPPTWLNNDTILQPVSRAEADIIYRLTVTGAGGCSASDEVLIKLLLKPVIPNAFSPNGDGINDIWTIRYLDTYPGATVQVFDRYGQVIFVSTGYANAWNGTQKGKPVPSGVYYYIVDPKNNVPPITGSVTILR